MLSLRCSLRTILMAFLLLNALVVCTRRGLIALAETYGLDRRELQQLKLLAEAFFEALRNATGGSIATPIRLSGLVQTIASFKEVAPARRTAAHFLGTPRRGTLPR